MRLSVLAAALVLAAAFAGCSSPAPADADAPAEDDARRTARPGFDGDTDEMVPVEFHRGPLTVAGQGPVAVDVEVPAGIEAVGFAFEGGATYEFLGLKIDLSGCGGVDLGLSSYSGGGGTFSGDLCGAAEPGRQTATVSGELVVFDGTFVLTGFRWAGNETATTP